VFCGGVTKRPPLHGGIWKRVADSAGKRKKQNRWFVTPVFLHTKGTKKSSLEGLEKKDGTFSKFHRKEKKRGV